jgi:uncharacterized protein YcgL (UPF0745 family)
MLVDVYRARKFAETKSSRTYLFLPHGVSISSLAHAVLIPFGLPVFLKTIDLGSPNVTPAEAEAIRKDLESKGYSIRSLQIE